MNVFVPGKWLGIGERHLQRGALAFNYLIQIVYVDLMGRAFILGNAIVLTKAASHIAGVWSQRYNADPGRK
jgi:hypothetical protein